MRSRVREPPTCAENRAPGSSVPDGELRAIYRLGQSGSHRIDARHSAPLAADAGHRSKFKRGAGGDVCIVRGASDRRWSCNVPLTRRPMLHERLRARASRVGADGHAPRRRGA
jgi:hypothetical protein